MRGGCIRRLGLVKSFFIFFFNSILLVTSNYLYLVFVNFFLFTKCFLKKSFFVICILIQRSLGLKLFIKGTSVHIKNIMELNSSVIIRFDILLRLCGPGRFPRFLRNGYDLLSEGPTLKKKTLNGLRRI